MKNKKKTVASVSFDHDLEDSISMVMPILTDCDPNEDFSEGIMSIDSTIPILALRNMVLLPGVAIPVVVGREKSMKLVRACADDHQLIGAFCQKDVAVEEPQQDDLFEIGTVAEIMRVLDMPDGTTTIILQGKKRIKLNEIVEESPYLRGKVTVLKDDKYSKDKEFNALISAIKDMMIKVLMTAVEPHIIADLNTKFRSTLHNKLLISSHLEHITRAEQYFESRGCAVEFHTAKRLCRKYERTLSIRRRNSGHAQYFRP